MIQPAFRRPDESEYLAYYQRYVALVPDGHILATLAAQNKETLALLHGLPEEKGAFRYAPGKWSIKELVGHVTDTERVFASRAAAWSQRFAKSSVAWTKVLRIPGSLRRGPRPG